MAENDSWISLLRAFHRVLHIFVHQDIGLKICLFVPGLDEYDGDCFRIVDLFGRITKLPCVQVSLPHRPLFKFVGGIESYSELRLQDLAAEEISQYVNGEHDTNG